MIMETSLMPSKCLASCVGCTGEHVCAKGTREHDIVEALVEKNLFDPRMAMPS
jgi:hypothetical protein